MDMRFLVSARLDAPLEDSNPFQDKQDPCDVNYTFCEIDALRYSPASSGADQSFGLLASGRRARPRCGSPFQVVSSTRTVSTS